MCKCHIIILWVQLADSSMCGLNHISGSHNNSNIEPTISTETLALPPRQGWHISNPRTAHCAGTLGYTPGFISKSKQTAILQCMHNIQLHDDIDACNSLCYRFLFLAAFVFSCAPLASTPGEALADDLSSPSEVFLSESSLLVSAAGCCVPLLSGEADAGAWLTGEVFFFDPPGWLSREPFGTIAGLLFTSLKGLRMSYASSPSA